MNVFKRLNYFWITVLLLISPILLLSLFLALIADLIMILPLFIVWKTIKQELKYFLFMQWAYYMR